MFWRTAPAVFLFALAALPQTARFRTNQGDIDVFLLPLSAPRTVQNFLTYANRGAYANSIVHRSFPGIIIQGGGYRLSGSVLSTIPADPPIQNEFQVSNTRGTIAMAKLSTGPHTATTQWFFNLADNLAFNTENGGYTVFGRAAGASSLATLDRIAALPTVNLGAPLDSTPLLGFSGGPVQPANFIAVESIQIFNSLTIVSPSEGQTVNTAGVTFSWIPVPGTGYLLEIKSGAATVFSGSLLGADSTSTLIGLPAGSYALSVRPCTATPPSAANCGAAVTRNFSVNLPAPTSAPAIVSPSTNQNFTGSTQTFSWSAVPGASRYEVLLRDMAAGGATELSISTQGTSTVYSMKSSTQYRLQVRACTEACGPFAAPVDFSVTLPAVPSAAPNAPACTVNGNRVSCNWNAIANADLYLIQIVQASGGPGGGALTVASRQVSETQAAEPNPLIAPTGAASVLVAACNGNGCGPNSAASAIAVAAARSTVPILGTPAAGVAVNGPEVLFSWNRVPGDNGSNTVYRLFVQDLSRGAPALDVLTAANFHAAKFRGQGSRFDALVIANPGASQTQGPASGFVVRGASPAAPTMVQPRHQTEAVTSSIVGSNLQLGWTPVTGATAYEYFVAVSGSPSPTARGVTPGLIVQIPVGSLATYSGIVRACPAGLVCAPDSEANWGPWSNAAGQTGVTTFRAGP